MTLSTMISLVHGCDAASAIQGRLPAAAMKTSGLEVCWLRGKVGNNLGRDALFEENARALKGNGIRTSPYEFAFPLKHLDPIEQAKGFAAASIVDGDLVGSRDGEPPPGYDLEWPPPEEWTKRGIDADFVVDFALAQLAQMTADWRRRPLVYLYPWFAVSLSRAKNFTKLIAYPLWIAGGPGYINGPGTWPTTWNAPKVPGWGDGAIVNQFDGNGGMKLPNGVDADFNVFRGSLADLETFCRVSQVIPDEPGSLDEPPPPEVIAEQMAGVLVDDAVSAYRRERAQRMIDTS
jgi:hypothetical protein